MHYHSHNRSWLLLSCCTDGDRFRFAFTSDHTHTDSFPAIHDTHLNAISN